MFRFLLLALCGLVWFGAAGVGSASASEPTACGFGLMQCDENGVVWGAEKVLGTNLTAQLSSSDGLAEFIISVGYFLQLVLLPTLIGLGLLFFLFNLARYYVLSDGNQEARDKAKSNTIWGLAAFVLIVSLWGIVNLFTTNLPIDRERSLCPDYLGAFCGNLGYDGVGGGSSLDFGNPSGGMGTGGGETGTGDDFGGGVSDNPDGVPPATVTQSRIGELLFGRQQEIVEFNFRTGPPRAAANTVTLGTNLSCVDGLSALQQAAQLEDSIGAYALYRQNGQLRWENITDNNGPFTISFDADTVNSKRIEGAQDIHIVHFHPAATIDGVGLNMSGYAPTRADLFATCSGVGGTVPYVVVDANNVWVATPSSMTCPRRAQETDDLHIISILLQLAMLAPGERNNEFANLLAWNDLPSSVRSDLRAYETTDFSSLSSAQLFAAADDIARQGDLALRQESVSSFCASY